MPKYVLLLHDDPATWQEMSPEELQKALQKFFAWRARLLGDNVLIGTAKLKREPGKVLRGKGNASVTDGPYSETKESLGGYFIIEAPCFDSAVDQCRDSPHLEYGGTIELREVEPVPGT